MKYSGRAIEAMQALATASLDRSIAAFEKALVDYKPVSGFVSCLALPLLDPIALRPCLLACFCYGTLFADDGCRSLRLTSSLLVDRKPKTTRLSKAMWQRSTTSS